MYFAIRVVTDYEGKVTKSMYDYGTQKQALKSYHGSISSLIDAENVKSFLCMAVDEKGKDIVEPMYVEN